MLRYIVSIAFLFFLLVCGGENLSAQNFPDRIWWTPGSISTLPMMDSLSRASPLSIIGLDFQHTLSLYSWSTSLRLGSNSFITTNPLTPLVSISAEARSRLREDTRIRTSEANALINADYPLDLQRNGLT